jgi:hypothetical protein
MMISGNRKPKCTTAKKMRLSELIPPDFVLAAVAHTYNEQVLTASGVTCGATQFDFVDQPAANVSTKPTLSPFQVTAQTLTFWKM